MASRSQIVVLAGGLATRMHPRTIDVPKSMLPVAGRPFVDRQLALLANSGAREVVMCVAHLGAQISAHVGDGARFGLHVVYAEEPPGVLLGTAGALRAALPLLADDFVVTYGDSYLPFDYLAPLRALRAHDDCDGVMAIFRNDGRLERSNVATDGERVTRYDKSGGDGLNHVDYGATALRRAVIAALPDGAYDLSRVQHDLAARGRLRAIVARERFYEIGSPSGLADLEGYLLAEVRSPKSEVRS
jgi:NDP-sugar pyrophosphorylase family protein